MLTTTLGQVIVIVLSSLSFFTMSNNAGGGIDGNMWEQFFGQQGGYAPGGTNNNVGNSPNSNAPTPKDVDILGSLLHIQSQARAFRQYQRERAELDHELSIMRRLVSRGLPINTTTSTQSYFTPSASVLHPSTPLHGERSGVYSTSHDGATQQSPVVPVTAEANSLSAFKPPGGSRDDATVAHSMRVPHTHPKCHKLPGADPAATTLSAATQSSANRNPSAVIKSKLKKPSTQLKVDDMLKGNATQDPSGKNILNANSLVPDSNVNQCIPSDTPFYTNWVSKGSRFDKLAFNDPKYVDGNVSKRFDKVPGISGRSCPIGWARDARGGKNKLSRCLGCWICPQFGTDGCFFRQRPQAPRRHKQIQQGTGDKVPPPKIQQCPIHGENLIRRQCKAYWTTTEFSDHWIITHTGFHDHPAPESSRASDAAKKELRQRMIEHPEVGPAKWAAGTISRQPASVLVNEAKFHNQSYVKNQKVAATKAFNKEVFGSHVAVSGVDAAFELFSTIENWNNMCYDNCLGSANKRRFIVRVGAVCSFCGCCCFSYQQETLYLL